MSIPQVLRWLSALGLVMALAACGCQRAQEPAPTGTEIAPTREPAEQAAGAPAAGGRDPVQAARELGTPTENPVVTSSSGLRFIDVKVGEGEAAKAGDSVSVHYTGWLVDGAKFDSSKDRGRALAFPLGVGRVIRGWDEGVAGMKPGGTRKLIIPPNLAYGSRGAPPKIPPNATLVFEVDLLGTQ